MDSNPKEKEKSHGRESQGNADRVRKGQFIRAEARCATGSPRRLRSDFSRESLGRFGKKPAGIAKGLGFRQGRRFFIVTKLDRLARSVVDLAGIVQKLEAKKVDLVVLDQGIDTTTMYGRLQFNILAAIGEFERELIKERSMEDRIKAIARRVKFGAKPKLTESRNLPT